MKDKVVVAMTGASGNMGMETLAQIMELDRVVKVKALLLNERRERRYARAVRKKYKNRVQIIFGNIADMQKCRELVADADYVLHLAAVIPPMADHHPKETDDKSCQRGAGAWRQTAQIRAHFHRGDIRQPQL